MLALRDIYWPPRFVHEFERLSQRDFDAVLVGGPPGTAPWIPAGLTSGDLRAQMHYAGYLRPQENGLKGASPVTPFVHAQVGGGHDGYTLGAALISAAHELAASGQPIRFQVSTGPLMNREISSNLQWQP